MSELQQNLPTIFDSSTCVRKGLCPVTSMRAQSQLVESHSLYFEQHGKGPEKVIFITGLNSSSFSWIEQVKHFAQTGRHSVLVFDNRGVGNSGVPRGPYTTKGMAEDIVQLLKYVEWNEEFHVVGISLGGMVAQELATILADRIVTLVLCVTKAGGLSWDNVTPWKGISALARTMVTNNVDVKVPMILRMLFPGRWLEEKDPDDPAGRTNYQIHFEAFKRRIEITRPQTLLGSVSQMSAATTHRVTPARLSLIGKSIPKVLLLTGDEDNLVRPSNSSYLVTHVGEAELVVWENTGHALHLQWPKKFNELLDRAFADGRERYTLRERQSSTI